jgi:nitric oxide reductase subunit C
MQKIIIFFILFACYIGYSILIYSEGTADHISVTSDQSIKINKGKTLFQQHNCVACHQIYGLGGYIGPELTTAWSDKNRGEAYMRIFLKNGGTVMPNFHFRDEEIDNIIAYLHYVDTTASTYR